MNDRFTLDEATIADVHAAYRAGTLTARALVQAYLERIATIDAGGARLNSILAIDTRALTDADMLDEHLRSTGEFVGPLHGIPVVLKDQIETAGLTTTFGSQTAADYVPEHDATIVSRLRQAGAIILAKTTMPDFATSWHSTSSVSGLTRNPYALDRDPGGSSGGTAAAVAANLATVGIGEDTGGSIRLPASFCNLVGLRATPGLISRNGLSPLVKMQDTPGPMTRTVTDAALLLDVLAGFDPADPYTATAAISRQQGSYADELDPRSLAQARIGVLRQAFGDDHDPAAAAVNTVIGAALDKIAATGAKLVDVTIPDLDHYVAYTSVYFSRSRADIDAFLASRPGIKATSIAQLHADGHAHPNLDLLAGIAAGPAVPTGDPEYHLRMEARETFQRVVIGIMAENDLDALCFPDVRIAAPTHSDVLASRWSCLEFPTNTVIASQLWMPAISVPAGFTTDGLPVGLELMALPYREADLLGLAYGVERATGSPRRAPSLPTAD
ncbi:amidase [Streptomyces shenzhenensis]|uniref:Amidase n=1 Tax=Streptomyces shenzhenensis TaxID=943815 RepID=A0A3M0ID60_9ACTN|nr:amidase [Streptomyces shenzhenensis]RMB85980.1 amidase [Streptomyces shenzhenensis]